MKTYDLSNFYQKLKEKFNKSNGRDTLIYLLEEFSNTINLEDERAIIFVGNELSSFLRVKGVIDLSYKIYSVIEKLVIKNYGSYSEEYATLLINIGDLDIVAKNNEKAIENLTKAEKIAMTKENNDYLLASIYNNRSAAFRNLKLFDQAENDINKAMMLTSNAEKIAVSQINLAEIKLAQNDCVKAINLIDKAISYYEKNNLYIPHLANAYATAASIYYKLNEYEKSIAYLEKAIDIFDHNIGNGPIRDMLLKNLAKVKQKRDSLCKE